MKIKIYTTTAYDYQKGNDRQYYVYCTKITYISIIQHLIYSLNSSTNLSTNFFLYLLFLKSKYSLISHNLLDTFTITRIPDKCCITYTSLILYIHIYIYLQSISVYYYKHSHLIYICIYRFHVTLYVLFHCFLTLD